MTEEDKRRKVERMARVLTGVCHEWAERYPLLIGQCKYRASDWEVCKKGCAKVTFEDWKEDLIKTFKMEKF